MKSPTRRSRGTRKLDNTMSVAGSNVRRTGDLVHAAGQVVTRRMTLGVAAMIDPFNADHVEFAKMLPEKTMAFSEAGMVFFQWSGKAVEQMTSFVANEISALAEAAIAITSCRTPADVAATQSSFAMVWLSRALSQSIALGSLAVRSQGAVMVPIHRTVTENARRLSR